MRVSGDSHNRSESRLWQYMVASAAIALLIAIKIVLLFVLPDVQFRVLDVVTIGVAGYLYGLRPALLALLLSVVGYFYVYIPPELSWRIAGATVSDWSQLGVLLVGDAIAAAAMSKLRQSRERLTAEVLERTHAEEEVRRGRYLLEEAEKLSHAGAWEWDMSGDKWSFSDEWLAIHGVSQRTLTPEQLVEIGYPDDREAIAAAFNDVRTGTRAYDIVHRIVRQSDGEVRVVRARGDFLRGPTGRVLKVFGFVQDITEQKHAEEALRENEAQLRTVLENITEGVVVSTLEGELTHWNRAALQMHGYANLEEAQKFLAEFEKVLELFEMDGTPIPLENWPMARVLRGETLRNWEVRINRTDQGWKKVFSYGGSVIFDPDGTPLLVLLTMADITERKQAEEEIKSLNANLERRVNERTAELQTSNKELQTLSYSIMHDLRTPLRAIGGFSDTLTKRYSDAIDEKGRDYLGRIAAAAQRMSSIIDNIHDLLRATRAEVRRQQVDLSQMAEEIMSSLREAHPERKAEVTMQPGMLVWADPSLLRSALGHLLENAWKFTGTRDTTTIELLSIEKNQERVYVLKDNGVGFDPAYADKLFAPFQRLHSQSDFTGAGMGLALVQRIVRRHGGDVWAESQVGKGATFYFTLGESHDERMQDTAG